MPAHPYDRVRIIDFSYRSVESQVIYLRFATLHVVSICRLRCFCRGGYLYVVPSKRRCREASAPECGLTEAIYIMSLIGKTRAETGRSRSTFTILSSVTFGSIVSAVHETSWLLRSWTYVYSLRHRA